MKGKLKYNKLSKDNKNYNYKINNHQIRLINNIFRNFQDNLRIIILNKFLISQIWQNSMTKDNFINNLMKMKLKI